MINTHSLEVISKTGEIASSLSSRQYKLDLMARFIGIKPVHPK